MRIARGVSRTVLVGKKYTIKFPGWRKIGMGGRFIGFCHGVICNDNERVSTRVGDKGINPVLFHFLFVNVYRTCEPVMVGNDFDYASISEPWMSVDPKPENLGILNGRVVWVDYG